MTSGLWAEASWQSHDPRPTARERRGDCLTSNAVDVNVAFGTTRTTRQHTATLNARGRNDGTSPRAGREWNPLTRSTAFV